MADNKLVTTQSHADDPDEPPIQMTIPGFFGESIEHDGRMYFHLGTMVLRPAVIEQIAIKKKNSRDRGGVSQW